MVKLCLLAESRIQASVGGLFQAQSYLIYMLRPIECTYARCWTLLCCVLTLCSWQQSLQTEIRAWPFQMAEQTEKLRFQPSVFWDIGTCKYTTQNSNTGVKPDGLGEILVTIILIDT